MAKMNGVNEHIGGMHVGNNGAGGSFSNGATARRGLSKGGVNKDLGGGAKSGTPQQLGVGKASDGNPGRQSTAGKSKGPIQRG